MKRIMIISLIMLFALTAAAFAAGTNVSTGIAITGTSGVIFQSSTKVTVIADSDGTASTADGSRFAVVSKHLQGNRSFGTAFDSTAILYNDTVVAVGTAIGTGDVPGDSIGAFSGWSSL